MKIHRFYTGDTIDLTHDVWVNDESLLHQWTRVLRFQPEQEIILFNNVKEERLYRITKIEPGAVHLKMVTQMSAKIPEKEVYLCFSLLKKDKNNWVLQKATELGIRHFMPIISSRTEKTGFDVERARKIVIEAAEQCGRADIPSVREPIGLETALREIGDKTSVLIAEQGSDTSINLDSQKQEKPTAVFIGPEGGWTDEEKKYFQSVGANHLSLSAFTLRAETACLSAATILCM